MPPPRSLSPEKVAIEKVCKIHRKLPAGGVLVFLTGKQEIIRCVNRLKQRLGPSNRGRKTSGSAVERNEQSFGRNDVHRRTLHVDDDALDGFRDMDDDEVDGDLFQNEEDEDDYDVLDNDDDADIDVGIAASDDDDKRPRKLLILPLYSMLSADEQAKVFSPVPEDTRLIVVATNIAETSITIPVRAYVSIMQIRHFSLTPQPFFHSLIYREFHTSSIAVGKNAVTIMLAPAWPLTMSCGLARRRPISARAERGAQVPVIVTGCIRPVSTRATWTNLRYPRC